MKFPAFVLILLVFQCISVPSYADDNWRGRKAVSLSLSWDEDFNALHGDVLAEAYATQYLSYGAGLSFLLSTETGLHGGFEGHVRCNLPGAFSPFVGTGLFVGRWTFNDTADEEDPDYNGNLFFTEDGEKEEVHDYLIAIYPEAGVHLWVSDSVRLTANVRYYITSKGRDSDRLLYGAGIAFAF